jgi:hypothetical protein
MANSPKPTHAVDVTGTVYLAVGSLAARAAYLGGLTPPVTDVRTPLTGYATLIGERFGGPL